MINMAGYKNFQVDRNKNKNNKNIFTTNKNYKKSVTGKSQRLMDGVDIWTSFYRANPHRFVADYFGIKLKLFQKILIYMMMHNYYFMYTASRGQG